MYGVIERTTLSSRLSEEYSVVYEISVEFSHSPPMDACASTSHSPPPRRAIPKKLVSCLKPEIADAVTENPFVSLEPVPVV